MSENNYKTRSNREIRSYARERLLGNMLVPCLVTFFFFSTRNTFEFLMQLGILGRDLFAFFFYVALSIAIYTVFGLVRFGITHYFLSFVTTKKASPISLFAGLGRSRETVIATSLMLTLISLLLQLPYLIYSFFFSVNTVQSLLVSLGLFLIGNIIMYFIEAYLAPIYFVICDNPDARLPMVIVMTLSLMNRKQFFRYIGLQISFIPLYLLGILSFGIGLLWVVPYAYTSYAYFYENLCENYIKANSSSQDSSI